MYILDTNIVSELMRPQPNDHVRRWAQSQQYKPYISAITLAEIYAGISLLPQSLRKNDLYQRLQNCLRVSVHDEILSFDHIAALCYAKMFSMRKQKGLHVAPIDLMIAAITLSHNATLITRNTKDFLHCGINVINPFNPC